MSDDDFNRLIEYTDELVINDTLPTGNFIAIQQIGISAEHIRYTFYRLHEKLFTTRRRRPKFYYFLRSVFRQLQTHEIETIRKKFKTHPKSYFTDFNISQ